MGVCWPAAALRELLRVLLRAAAVEWLEACVRAPVDDGDLHHEEGAAVLEPRLRARKVDVAARGAPRDAGCVRVNRRRVNRSEQCDVRWDAVWRQLQVAAARRDALAGGGVRRRARGAEQRLRKAQEHEQSHSTFRQGRDFACRVTIAFMIQTDDLDTSYGHQLRASGIWATCSPVALKRLLQY